jgi:prepilin-type N-terminal cleavage/methylation domain-containing protein
MQRKQFYSNLNTCRRYISIANGFTLVELMVVVVSIGIISMLATTSFVAVQTDTRDYERKTSIEALTVSLEDYYSKHGEYPSCGDMSQSVYDLVTNTLPDIEADILTAPNAIDGTNSILASCADINNSDDSYAYIGDGSATCLTGSACTSYTLKYLEESTGNTISINSRHN